MYNIPHLMGGFINTMYTYTYVVKGYESRRALTGILSILQPEKHVVSVGKYIFLLRRCLQKCRFYRLVRTRRG